MASDWRLAWRLLRRSPGVSALAILTLALGIGANSAIFSVLNAVLLRPFPFREPDRIVVAWESLDTIKSGFLAGRIPVRLNTWLRWKERNRAFEGLAGALLDNVDLSGIGKPERVEGARVPADFFRLLGVRPALGRALTADDERGGAVLVSHAFWKDHLGGSPQALGRTLRVNGAQYSIVGVVPAEFHLPALMEGFDQQRPKVWVAVDPQALRKQPDAGAPRWTVFARLKHSVTAAQGAADLASITQQLRREEPDSYLGWSSKLYPVRDEDAGPQMRRTLLLLQGAVLVVLLIACVNVANLLLARMAARERELAVRVAMGAGAFRIARQLFAETLLLTGLGGAAGVACAPLILKGLAALEPDINRPETWRVDASVLLFTSLLAVGSALLVTFLPAWLAARRQPAEALRTRGASSGPRRARQFLIAAEVALASILLVGAGLLIRSLQAVMRIDPGFRPDKVLTVNIELPVSRYAGEDRQRLFCERLLERIKNLPGIQSTALANGVPMQSISMATFEVEGRPAPPHGREPIADYRQVSPEYFATMGGHLIQGRGFTREDALEKNVSSIVVNQSFARRTWPGQDPVGKAIVEDKRRVRVVGVVQDMKQIKLEEPVRPEMFRPRLVFDSMLLLARTALPADRFGKAVSRELAALDPELPMRDVRALSYMVSTSMSQRRFNMIVLGAFAGLALLLAGVGIYGVVSYAVARRTQEIGVRMALGASRPDVLKLVVRESLGVVLAGLVAGGAVAALAVRLVQALLYGVWPWDPLAFGAAAVLLILATLAASLVPALRASAVEPNAALRYE